METDAYCLPQKKIPKVLTEQDVNNYSITDVVYPLPGKQSVYPENEIKDLYRKFMGRTRIWYR